METAFSRQRGSVCGGVSVDLIHFCPLTEMASKVDVRSPGAEEY